MVDILPFCGIHYAEAHASEPVYAPPYDVISPRQRDELLASDAFSTANLIIGPDPAPDQWYGEAAAELADWLDSGILLQDAVPALYCYEQHFDVDGRSRVRKGFFARVLLTQWGRGVYRHERTRSGPKADRLRLMRAQHAQTGPVFALYQDPADELGGALRAAPRHEIANVEQCGARHMLSSVTDPNVIQAVCAEMVSRDLVIADGHHRYETALAYKDEQRALAGHDGSLSSDYVMMYLVPVSDPGLSILPAHRVLANGLLDEANTLLARLAEHFLVERAALHDLERAIQGQPYTFGLYHADGAWVLRLREAPAGDPLDAALLQDDILAPLLGITEQNLVDSHVITYTIHEPEAREAVHNGSAAAAFVLNGTRLDQVWSTAMARETMPQKSTFFSPKPLTGLVINPLGSGCRP